MMSEVVQTVVTNEQYLTFKIGENLVGIPLRLVETIEFVPEIIQIPRSPDHVLGVANIENAIIPILDLELLLKYKNRTLIGNAISIIIAIEHAVFGIHITEPPKVVLLENNKEDSTTVVKSNLIPEDWIERSLIDQLDRKIIILNPERFWIGLGRSNISGPASGGKKVNGEPKKSKLTKEKLKVSDAQDQNISDDKANKSIQSKKNVEKKSIKKKIVSKSSSKDEREKSDKLTESPEKEKKPIKKKKKTKSAKVTEADISSETSVDHKLEKTSTNKDDISESREKVPSETSKIQKDINEDDIKIEPADSIKSERQE